MQTRELGLSGLKVSALGLGCMAMTDLYGAVDEGEAVATIREALDRGADHLDTSDMYAAGANEQMIGRALKDGYRAKAIVATKFGNLRTLPGGPPSGVDGRPEYVVEACEASLKRLNIEVIDLFYQHRVDPNTPIEDTVGAMSRLVEQGKVRFLGLSEAGVDTLRRACAVHPISALQTEYSLWCRFVEDDVLPACRELGVGFVPYSPLGRGMLTGAISSSTDLAADDRRKAHPRFQDANLQSNAALIRPLVDMARAKGCSPAQLALAWLLAQGADIAPIPGTKRRSHLRDNLAALDIGLSAREASSLAAAIDDRQVAGTRYPQAQMSMVGI